MENQIQPKDIVIYRNQRFEIGIVKSVNYEKQTAFVVYNCAEKWKEIENYTACCTDLSDLEKVSILNVKLELQEISERQAILNKSIEVYNIINNN